MTYSLSKKKGFTLMELMVVIAIFTLLSSIVFAGAASAREKAKISQVKQNLVQMRLALTMYYNDYGRYPSVELPGFGNDGNRLTSDYNLPFDPYYYVYSSTTYPWPWQYKTHRAKQRNMVYNDPTLGGNIQAATMNTLEPTGNWIPGLVPNYISSLPRASPSKGEGEYMYRSDNGAGYKLVYLNPELLDTKPGDRFYHTGGGFEPSDAISVCGGRHGNDTAVDESSVVCWGY